MGSLVGSRRQDARHYWKYVSILVVIMTAAIAIVVNNPRTATHAAGGISSMFLGGNSRTGYNSAPNTITAATVSNLKLQSTYQTRHGINAQAVVANGQVYWGSWDGNEYATDLTGKKIWSVAIGGQTPNCNPPDVYGVASSAAVANILINGINTSVVFVGGKDAKLKSASLYALDATTGAVIWETPLTSSSTSMTWSSPAIFGGSVYIGLSSVDDCPLIQAGLFQLNATTGAIEHTFYTVPSGCVGASVWGSPTINEATGTIFFVTGNNGPCSTTEIYGQAIVELHVSDLSYIDSWQVPPSQYVTDSDFGSTPTLFTATLGGSTHEMVGAINKNGIYYAFDQSSIHTGPVWIAHIATTTHNISSSAWDGTTLYVAGRSTTIRGKSCLTSLRALNPATGAFIWQDCLNTGFVFAPVSAIPGVVFVGAGPNLIAVAAGTGQILFDYKTSRDIYGAASIANGIVYVGNASGTLYIFGLPSTVTPTPITTPSPTPITTPLPTSTVKPSPSPSPTPLPGNGPTSKTWYFAEGKVGTGFTEYLTIENPDPTNDCSVNIEYLLGSSSPINKSVTVPHASRFTESVNNDLNTPAGFGNSQTDSAVVSVTNPTTCAGVVVERPIYFTNFAGVSSGSDALGATYTGTTFYFADVPTGGGYASFLTILNPGSTTATVTATFVVGGVPLSSQTQTISVAGGTRGTIIPNNNGALLHAAVTVTSSQPVVVERPTYFHTINGGNAHTVSGASSVVGVQTLQKEWLFAEGYTGSGFQENFVLANFGSTPVSTNVVLEFSNGHTETVAETIQPSDQTMVNVNDIVASNLGTCDTSPCQPTQDVSADITGNGNFIAQREMYFQYTHIANGRSLSAIGGTDVIGEAAGNITAYSFAEGYTNVGYDEWLTLQNPTASTETVTLTLVNEEGRSFKQLLTLVAHSRFTVDITALVLQALITPGDGFQGYEVSMVVQSGTGTFVAERPMYWNIGSQGIQGGSDILGFTG